MNAKKIIMLVVGAVGMYLLGAAIVNRLKVKVPMVNTIIGA